jgi:hypothetical protein
MGFVNDISYKAFDVNAVVDWQKGGDVINLTQFLMDDGRTSEDWGTPEVGAALPGLPASAPSSRTSRTARS